MLRARLDMLMITITIALDTKRVVVFPPLTNTSKIINHEFIKRMRQTFIFRKKGIHCKALVNSLHLLIEIKNIYSY